jgi:putative transcriptional regulator
MRYEWNVAKETLGRRKLHFRMRIYGETRQRSRTGWARVRSLTNAQALAGALADPDAPPLTARQLAGMRRVSRVKRIRRQLGMTQEAFAQAFHLPLSTLRDWEQHRSKPDAPARALLLAIERAPQTMVRLLAEKAA